MLFLRITFSHHNHNHRRRARAMMLTISNTRIVTPVCFFLAALLLTIRSPLAAVAVVPAALGLLVAAAMASSLAPITLKAIKADAAAVGRALINPKQYQHELTLLLAHDWTALQAAAAKDVAAVDAMLLDAGRLLRRDWHVCVPLAVGLCVTISLSRLLLRKQPSYDPREAAARTTVGELGPVGECLVELAALTQAMQKFGGGCGGSKKKE
jgi:hypothetical protein